MHKVARHRRQILGQLNSNCPWDIWWAVEIQPPSDSMADHVSWILLASDHIVYFRNHLIIANKSSLFLTHLACEHIASVLSQCRYVLLFILDEHPYSPWLTPTMTFRCRLLTLPQPLMHSLVLRCSSASALSAHQMLKLAQACRTQNAFAMLLLINLGSQINPVTGIWGGGRYQKKLKRPRYIVCMYYDLFNPFYGTSLGCSWASSSDSPASLSPSCNPTCCYWEGKGTFQDAFFFWAAGEVIHYC